MKVFSQIKKKKMPRKLTGTITCKQADIKQIEKGAILIVQVSDVSLMDAPAKVLGRVQISDPLSFPIKYEIVYDAERIIKKRGSSFSVSARIERNGKLEFTNDTRFNIINYKTKEILDKVDFFVIKT